jgi:hypothetical protein
VIEVLTDPSKEAGVAETLVVLVPWIEIALEVYRETTLRG